MTAHRETAARKRPVNLTLNEDLVAEARRVTANLSATIESLLADFLARERERRAARARECEAAAVMWNKFGDEYGSIADEYSPL